MRIGLYPGTFDPITRGHLDIIKRACVLVDKLVQNPRDPLTSKMIERNLSKFEHNETNIIVEPFENLLIDKATEVGAQIIIRGLRAVSDFEYEYQLVGMNRAMNDNIETTFLMAEAKHQAIASRLVKEIARLNGDVSKFVTPGVETSLKEKFKHKV